MDYDAARKRLQDERSWMATANSKQCEKHRIKGKLHMSERIGLLLDKGSWFEYGEFARSSEPEANDRSPRDGVFTGIGTVNGQPIAIIAHDITTLGGSQSYVNVRKVDRMIKLAIKKRFPIIVLCEGGGVRLPDGVGLGFARLVGLQTIHSLSTLAHPGIRPLLISAVFGYCYGDQALWAAYSDFTIMVQDSSVALSGPPVLEAAISEKITDLELGGPIIHQTITGVTDFMVKTEAQAIDRIKQILHILRAPEMCSDPVDRLIYDAESIVPHDNKQVYDMRKIITRICDNAEFMETKARYGTGLVVGLGRIGGQVVGIVASQPNSAGGAVDAKGIRKSAEFLEFINIRKIPLLVLQDIPGFLVGSAVEKDGLLKAVQAHCRVLEALEIAMVALIIRKAYGAAYYFLGTGASGAQFVAAWPNAEISFMSPKIGAYVLTKHIEPEKKKEVIEKTITELERGASVWDAAREFWLDAIIDPKETRKMICHAFRLLSG
jgi:acetyl-CoA carboxylase carboxyltransferase component